MPDHDHVTGQYRDAACNLCNLLVRRSCRIHVFFHNIRGYDSHFVTQALKYRPREEIGIIGQGMEKYLTLRLGDRLVFMDSYLFLVSDLQHLPTICARLELTSLSNSRLNILVYLTSSSDCLCARAYTPMSTRIIMSVLKKIIYRRRRDSFLN